MILTNERREYVTIAEQYRGLHSLARKTPEEAKALLEQYPTTSSLWNRGFYHYCVLLQKTEKIEGPAPYTYSCSECGNNEPTVQFGVDLDHESNETWICKSCLQKALALFDKE